MPWNETLRSAPSTSSRFFFPEQNGGGVALLNFDNDGALDVLFVQCGRITGSSDEIFPHGLFRNRGDGSIEDVTSGSGVATGGYGMAVAAGDFDADQVVELRRGTGKPSRD